MVALAIDFGMLGTPGATGGGMVYRFAMAGGKTIDIVIDCSKLAKVAQQGSVKLAQVLPHILTAQSGSGGGGGSGGSGSSSSSGGNRDRLMDEHPTLSNDAADMALQGPPNTTPRVKGASGAGADIEFIDNLGNVILQREVKVHTGDLSSLSSRVSKGASQVNYNGEVFVQISSSIDIPAFFSHFSKYRANIVKYQNVVITFVDESAQVLYSGKVTP